VGGARRAATAGGNWGKPVVRQGEWSGSENRSVDGQFEGKIGLKGNGVTVGPNGRSKAGVLFAKSVNILGRVTGKITAVDIVSIRENGSVEGDIAAPRISIADGAHFRGTVDMSREGAKSREAGDVKPPAAVKPPVKSPAPPPPPRVQQGDAPAPRVARPVGARQGR